MNRVLLIEDETAVAKGLRYGLETEGFDVHWAQNARTGIDIVKKTPPELLILDIRLPDMSGFDLCRKLREDGNRSPILMLTARDEEEISRLNRPEHCPAGRTNSGG